MAKTITEKIMAKAANKAEVSAGELIDADIDMIMCHDVTTPPAISMLREKGITKVFDPEKIAVTPDHFQPAKDIKSAELHKRLDTLAKEQKLPYYYKLGRAGVCHALLPEQGHIRPGEVIVGGDSHTCTYGAFGAFSTGVGSTDLAAALATGKLWFKVPSSLKFVLAGKLPAGVFSKDVILEAIRRIGTDGALYKAMEFVGPALSDMSMEARMTITNMAIEAGAKNGVIGFDDVTKAYLEGRLKGKTDYEVLASDPDAVYDTEDTIDCSSLKPMVAFPHLPSNGRAISDCAGLPMDQAYIPTTGHALALSYLTSDPARVGVNIESAHAILAGLDPSDEMGFALAYDKLFTVHLNDQNGLKFDEDKSFGSVDLRRAFNQVRILDAYDYGQDGAFVGLDVKAMRTQKQDACTKHLSNSRAIFMQLLDLVQTLDKAKVDTLIQERDYEELDLLIVNHLMGK